MGAFFIYKTRWYREIKALTLVIRINFRGRGEGFYFINMQNIEVENSRGFDLTKEVVTNRFSWMRTVDSCLLNAGSTRGGQPGHDLDLVFMFNFERPEDCAGVFAHSLSSMDDSILELWDKNQAAFSFSKVAWQDFMKEQAEIGMSRTKAKGIHFLWYASPSQLMVAEPRGLALGLLQGEILWGDSKLIDEAIQSCPDKDTSELWGGFDGVLDAVRLVANPHVGIGSVLPPAVSATIGHTLERVIIWDLLGSRIRKRTGLDLVTREDVNVEKRAVDPLLLGIMDQSRQLRDGGLMNSRDVAFDVGMKIINNWSILKGLK